MLVVLVILAAYWNSFAGVMQFDDYNVIADNPAVASVAAWWRSMPGIRPLLKLSYALNREIAGLAGFHLVNIALHAGNALLLLTLFRKLLGTDHHGATTALLAAMLFAAHPVHSEAVTMISGRSMSLMTFFYLASVLLYLDETRKSKALSLIAFILAITVRETAITLPLALLLIERQRSSPNQASKRQEMQAMLIKTQAYWTVAVLAAALLLFLPAYRNLAVVSLNSRPLIDNLITQSAAQFYLLQQWSWPINLDADPMLPVFTTGDWTPIWIASILGWTSLLGCGLLAWWRQGKNELLRWGAFGVVWFYSHLMPTNSFLPRLDVANERHLYLATAGLTLFVALCLTMLANRYRRATIGGAIALVIVLSTMTGQRNKVYHSETAFWQDIVTKNPDNARAHNNLGYAYAREGRPAEAISAYDEAIKLAPNDFKPRLNRRAICHDNPIASTGNKCTADTE